jgi:hypothetical protein
VHPTLKAAVLFTITGLVLCGPHPKSFAVNPQVVVTVYNDARISSDLITQAEQRAAEIFWRAALEVIWVNCTALNGARDAACAQVEGSNPFVLRIIPRVASSTSAAAFGVAFLAKDGTGRYADVFWQRVQELHENSNVGVAGILGSVMAHEIGHLLLGSNAHSVSGIMRAHWEAAELRRINMGALLFLTDQEVRMRARIAPASRRAENSAGFLPTSISRMLPAVP